MKRISLFSLVVALTMSLTACFPMVMGGVMGANLLASGAIGKSMAERKADRCFKVENAASGKSSAAKNRDLRAAGCME